MIVLLSPIISEKSMAGVEANKYIFKVDPKVNKHQIAEAVEKIYKVTVLKVNIIKNQGENRVLRGKYKVPAKKTKKAIVTLKKGDKIKGFEIKE